jgi:hypothetical protein
LGRATWEACNGNLERKNGNHPSICSKTQENQEKPVLRGRMEEGWVEKGGRKKKKTEDWKKLLTMARSCHILHTSVE